MCGHVFLVFLGGRLPWVTDVSHLCTSVIESHLSVLHVPIVRLTVQLDTILIVRRTQHTVTFSLFFAALIQLRSQFAWTLFSSLTPPAVKKLGCFSRT